MAGKQITDLTSADSFNDGDLLLVRKSGMGVDRKINYADFVESIGNPAINGFIAIVEDEQEDRLVLNSVNNVTVYKYYEGMKISFISPVQSNDITQIRIGNLSYKKLLKSKSDIGVMMQVGDYIEAVLIGEHFRQVNDLMDSANIYTNDFLVTASEIAPDNQSTVLTLQTAYGRRKQEYYKGMSILFTCPKNIKGKVRVNIDGLDLIDLKEGGSNGPNLNLKKEQIIWATYEGGKFIFNSALSSSILASASTTSPSIPNVLPIPVVSTSPLVKNETIEVNPNGLIKTIGEAIDKLIELFGPNGGGKKYTILLESTFKWLENVTIKSNQKLDWITIKSDKEIFVPRASDLSNVYSLTILQDAVCPVLELKILLGRDAYFILIKGGTVNLNHCSFRPHQFNSVAPIIFAGRKSKILISNCIIDYASIQSHNGLICFQSTDGDMNHPLAELHIDNTTIKVLNAVSSLLDNRNHFFDLSIRNSKIEWNVGDGDDEVVFWLTGKTIIYNTSIHNSSGGIAHISRFVSPQDDKPYCSGTPFREDYIMFDKCTLSSGVRLPLRIHYGDCRILDSSLTSTLVDTNPLIAIDSTGRLIKDSKSQIGGPIANFGNSWQIITI